ncbi:MAG: outer membrane lipoprotein-sorting protein [Gammaproteobacteria bacterium]|nr:outer membrane lipoprotein-sorting protein [Gammaproteobacteria bacterium]
MNRLFLLILFGLLPLAAQAGADEEELARAISDAKTPEAKGLAIERMLEYRNAGWKDSKADMLMILRNRHGEESKRDIRVKYMEVIGDGDKSLSIFDTPRDIKGTAMLTWAHALKADDQWLYLPALKRIKRISSRNKSGPFMGSEFAYEDLASRELEKYTYKYLRDESYQGADCYVTESYPAYKYSGYTRQQGWIDKKRFIPMKIVYYDRKDAELKTSVFNGYKQYLDKYWRPDEMFMENHQTGKSTTLRFSNYEFGKGLTNRDFDKNTLKRVR